MKKIFILVLLLLIFINISIASAYQNDDLYDDWNYVKIINISENSGENLTDYQVMIHLQYNESMNPDFSDIRFSYYNETLGTGVEVPYWIGESEPGVYANAWIKVPIIPSNSNSLIKMYYGNPLAVDQSNGESVFELFDDFEYSDSPLNHGWIEWPTKTSGEHMTSTHISKFGSRSLVIDTAGGKEEVLRISVPNGGMRGIIWAHYVDSAARNDGSFCFDDSYPVDNVVAQLGLVEVDCDPFQWAYIYGTLEWVCADDNINKWKKLEIRVNSTDGMYYLDDVFVGNRNATFDTVDRYALGDWWSGGGGKFYYDGAIITKYVDNPPTYEIIDVPAQDEPLPHPTENSLIITTSEIRNLISAASADLPLLVADSMTYEIQKFVSEYSPDYIYTIGFSVDMNNSYEISYSDVPELFFPEAGRAVYVLDEQKAVLASGLAHYMGIPVIFEWSDEYEILNLEEMNIDEINQFYVEEVLSNGDNINHMILTNTENDDSLLAGYVAGIRKGIIIPVTNNDSENVKSKIHDTIELLEDNGMFSSSVNYKKGEPLYMTILGDEYSIPFFEIPDMGFEIFDNDDGNVIYSDFPYGDVNSDGVMDIAVGRMDGGLSSTSLNFARQLLPRKESVSLIGEYKYGKIVDALNMYGGMTQSFVIDRLILHELETSRIVEKRIDMPEMGGSIEEIVKKFFSMVGTWTVEKILSYVFGPVISVFSNSQIAIDVVYSLFEFDWALWIQNPISIPQHLQVIDHNINSHISEDGVVGYFGLGDEYWTIPSTDRAWIELYFYPYLNSEKFTEIIFPGFLYDDHDMSADSEIKNQVISQGGHVFGSSGLVHDPYTSVSSFVFFRNLAAGKSIGESFLESLNSNIEKGAISMVYQNFPVSKFDGHLYLKDSLERILFGDPSFTPFMDSPLLLGPEYSVSPSNSFKMSVNLESNYTINDKKLMVFNADTYLFEKEKPVIPLFVREFILPTNSVVKSIDVDCRYSNKYGIKADFLYNNSHYTNYTKLLAGCMDNMGITVEPTPTEEKIILECVKEQMLPVFEYPYPENKYWYYENNLIDNRKLITVYLPAFIQKNDHLTKIVDECAVSVDYESVVEMDVRNEDVLIGQVSDTEIEIFNQGAEISGNLYLWISDSENEWEFEKTLTIPENSSVNNHFSLLPENTGVYEVKSLFITENITIGPRISYFSVGELNFDLDKRFIPNKVRVMKNKLFPRIDVPKIKIRNTCAANINKIELTEEIPEGFHLPGKKLHGNIPVFVLYSYGNNVMPFRKTKMIRRKYYDVSLNENGFSLTIDKNLGPDELITVRYVMISDKMHNDQSMYATTSAKVFSGNISMEKEISKEIIIN